MDFNLLRFGIPSLDSLIGRHTGSNTSDASQEHASPAQTSQEGPSQVVPSQKYGFRIPDVNTKQTPTTSVCILGPDGTGKSVLALHLASRYASDSYTPPDPAQPGAPRRVVLYASTDLSYEMAHEKWIGFALDRPDQRTIPFREENSDQNLTSHERLYVHLVNCQPTGDTKDWIASKKPAADHSPRPLSVQLLPPPAGPRPDKNRTDVLFVDLAATTAGDDWGFLSRVLGSLETLKAGTLPHLLIVDAVEGLETLVGEQDSFGQRRSRRSRIAQMLRMAADKCHVAFVVEQPRDGDRLPEEFISDLVIRLRSVNERDYSRRTVEVAKARGQENHRGQHSIVIRSGEGSCSLEGDVNPDDPELPMKIVVKDGEAHSVNVKYSDGTAGLAESSQSYFHVFQSIHSLSRTIMKQRVPKMGESAQPVGPAAFGITDLDEMLGPRRAAGDSSGSPSGLPRKCFSALIGDDGTHKSRLGRAFLSRCFWKLGESPKVDCPGWGEVAVLLTTSDLNAKTLAEKMLKHLPDENRTKMIPQLDPTGSNLATGENLLLQAMRRNIVCRSLEIHDLSPALFFHIIQCAVREAKSRLDEPSPPGSTLLPTDGRVRLVVDDWSTIRDTYPAIAEDPLILPFLKFYLEREGVTTLLIDTQPGGPEHIVTAEADRALRALVNHHIYTWNVPFFGERRIAIAAIPPVYDDQPVMVRELRPSDANDGEGLAVDPHFELYMGLERGESQPVPLQISLYAEIDGMRRYIAECNELFCRLFTPRGDSIIRGESPDSYERLQEFRYLQADNRLDHTLVFQVDEFWADSVAKRVHEEKRGPAEDEPAKEESEKKCPVTLESAYLDQFTVDKTGRSVHTTDPYGLFALPSTNPDDAEIPSELNILQRWQFFSVVGYAHPGPNPLHGGRDWVSEMDRVPFMWDFGILLLQREAWENASSSAAVACIWDREKGTINCDIDWATFFKACRAVARSASQKANSPVYAFDLDMLGLETFSSLVLEIWASASDGQGPDGLPMPELRGADREWGLLNLLDNGISVRNLYRAWLILGEILRPDQFEVEDCQFKTREAKTSAVAARHWYSTAADATIKHGAQQVLVPSPLPGCYAVRGDWFLAVASGSRSTRLGFQAIDLLCSNRANGERLLLGAGLPVRCLSEPPDAHDGDAPDTQKEELKADRQSYVKSARTQLWSPERVAIGGRMSYKELLAFGPTSQYGVGRENFHWFWRSGLKDYDRQNRVWTRWLCRIMMNWQNWRSQDGGSEDGFTLYESTDPDRYNELESFRSFKELCKFAVAQMKASTSHRRSD